jgi:hypothetical protein
MERGNNEKEEGKKRRERGVSEVVVDVCVVGKDGVR